MDEKVVEQVRIHYAEAATAVLTRGEATSGSADAGCCGTDSACCGASTLPAGEGAVFYGPAAAETGQHGGLRYLGGVVRPVEDGTLTGRQGRRAAAGAVRAAATGVGAARLAPGQHGRRRLGVVDPDLLDDLLVHRLLLG